VVDANYIRKILPDGTTSTVGGGAIEVGGLAADANGNVYFSNDQDSTIRKMDSKGVLTTIAGNGTMGYMNGTLGAAGTTEFNTPGGVGVDSNGDIYVADTANCYVRIIHQ
jgi:streptogramin lyase